MSSVARQRMPPSLAVYKCGWRGEKWSHKSQSMAYPPVTYKNAKHHPRQLPPAKSQWKYSKAQLKAHMMLPEPLPIPKSVLYDYKKKKPAKPNNTRLKQTWRSNSNESTGSFDSGIDDFSDTCSEYSERLWMENEEETVWRPPRLNSHVVPLPLSPGFSINQSSEEPLLKTCTSASPLGQLHFQCARCYIMYPSVELMEQHIGKYHIRLPEGEIFQLSEDNFSTLVKAAWDGDLTACVSSNNRGSEVETEQLGEKRPCSSLTDGDSGIDTDCMSGDESFGGSTDSSVFEEDIFDASTSRAFSANSRLIFGGKSVLADAMRKITRIMEMDPELGMPLPLEEDFACLLPKKLKTHLPRDKLMKMALKKGLRKCRGVYGIDSQDKWCSMCRWKKRCSRFSNLGDEKLDEL